MKIKNNSRKAICTYNLEDFYVGELYLYTPFANLSTNPSVEECQERITAFESSRAISFQKEQISRYIDWEKGREYQGFLTIFYRIGNKYLCLHDQNVYELNGPNFIDNLIPLSELLPKINAENLNSISIPSARGLFDILFRNTRDESQLYTDSKESISDYYVGDIVLKEYTPEITLDTRRQYFNLPYHIMLNKNNQSMYCFESSDCVSTVYRCLFLKDIVDLYNINNNQFYNPNEDQFESIVPFQDYMNESKIELPTETISIPKALKLFKKTI